VKLKQTGAQSQMLMGQLREFETREQLVRKETELQLTQAQQREAEMATELGRMHKDRRREDEFARVFQHEFEAHKLTKAKCTELQNQLDSVLDSLDAMRQKQEVLKHAMQAHGVEIPYVELEPAVKSAMVKPQPEKGLSPAVAISHQPITSPGVFNQHVDRAGYMPPHSNAESTYQEQQAERKAHEWQQQQQMYHQQQGMGGGAASMAPTPQGALAVPNTQQMARCEAEAVVGIPPSVAARPITPRSPQPHAANWQLQSRHSDSEILARNAGPMHPQPYVNYPTSQSTMPGGQMVPRPVVNVQSTAGQAQMQSQGQSYPHGMDHPQNQAQSTQGQRFPQGMPNIGHPQNQPQPTLGQENVGQALPRGMGQQQMNELAVCRQQPLQPQPQFSQAAQFSGHSQPPFNPALSAQGPRGPAPAQLQLQPCGTQPPQCPTQPPLAVQGVAYGAQHPAGVYVTPVPESVPPSQAVPCPSGPLPAACGL
jgi:hypothetical protein